MKKLNQQEQIVDEDKVIKPTPEYRRIRKGTTVTDLDEVKKSGIPDNTPEGFTDSTIETLLNASKEMFIVIGRPSLEILAVNKAVEKKLNASYVDLNSMYPLFFQDTLISIAAGNSELKNQVMTSESGEDHFVDIETTPIYWHGQDALLIKVIEKDEKISKEDHESTVKSIGLMAAGIAHDVKNVLSVLLGNLSMMEADSIDEAGEYDVNGMMSSVYRAVSILDTYMRFNTNAELVLEKNDLYKFVQKEIQDSFKWQSEYGIELRFIETAKPCECNFDVVAMSQILLNLLQNSKDAMPAGGTITIAVRNYSLKDISQTKWENEIKQDSVCIYFEDDGTGISQENLNDIFKPEFSTKRQTLNRYGLGLAVVKGQVEKHGGKIFVESKTGDNSCTRFYIFLPKAT